MGDDVEVAIVPGGCRIDEAQRPSDIPGGGWFAVLQRIGRSLSRDDVWLRSAGVAFNALFAAIPIAAVVVSVVGLLADPQTVHDPVEMLGGLLPSHVSQFLADQMQGIALTSRIHLGAGLGGATFAALWGAWSGASGLIAALNLAYREVETRSFSRRSCHALLVAFGAGVFIVLAFALVALLPLTLDRLSADPALRAMVSFARWPALAVLCALALAVLYKFAPSRRAAKWRWVTPGAGAAALWLAASATLSLYASNMPSYNQAFGVIGMLIMLLSWSYLTSFAVLFGAELNAELERQTSQDTTIGPSRRLGERGAAVADAKVNTMRRQERNHLPPDPAGHQHPVVVPAC